MTRLNDTIYALSSGALPSGLAVIRVSGPVSLEIVKVLAGEIPALRYLQYTVFRNPASSGILDRGMVCVFPGPASFTGEDCAEFHLHGGPAVVSRFLSVLASIENTRMAEPGEFSRRAFENGKLDLTEAEGLADLIAAETELQRRQAVSQSGGKLREKLDGWRGQLIRARAFIEAEFDFSDEEDVPDSMVNEVLTIVGTLKREISALLSSANAGEIIRNGFRVALVGPPNAGKSSLLNALTKRDVAIVSAVPGTTRDVLEVTLNIAGIPVIVTDTAGMRETKDAIEEEGIRRAFAAANEADLVVWLNAVDVPSVPVPEGFESGKLVEIVSKGDLADSSGSGLTISTREDSGLEALIEFLEVAVKKRIPNVEDVVINRQRHRNELNGTLESLTGFLESDIDQLDVGAEYLRLASDHLGRLTGRVDVEDLLDVVFSEFCVGK